MPTVRITFSGLWLFVRQINGTVDALAIGEGPDAGGGSCHGHHDDHSVHTPVLFVAPPFEEEMRRPKRANVPARSTQSRHGRPYFLSDFSESRLILDEPPSRAKKVTLNFGSVKSSKERPESVAAWQSMHYIPTLRDLYPGATLDPPVGDGAWFPRNLVHSMRLNGGTLRANPPSDVSVDFNGFPFKWTPDGESAETARFVGGSVTYTLRHNAKQVEMRLYGPRNVGVVLKSKTDVWLSACCEPFEEAGGAHPGKLPHLAHLALGIAAAGSTSGTVIVPDAPEPQCPADPNCPPMFVDIASL